MQWSAIETSCWWAQTLWHGLVPVEIRQALSFQWNSRSNRQGWGGGDFLLMLFFKVGECPNWRWGLPLIIWKWVCVCVCVCLVGGSGGGLVWVSQNTENSRVCFQVHVPWYSGGNADIFSLQSFFFSVILAEASTLLGNIGSQLMQSSTKQLTVPTPNN